jgi:tRNA A37 threonylcarbamoyladenosine dehydratase
MRFERIESLYGTAAFERFADSRVAVVGIGGVGSYAVEALARSGIGALVLIDDDVVELSNVNRQLWARDGTIGRLKVEVAAQRVRDINPACRLEPRHERLTDSNAASVLSGRLDAVIDAIDRVDDKIALLTCCLAQRIRVVACMGAAGRTDPTKVRYGDSLSGTGCPLAKAVRRGLRAQGVEITVPTVYSTERPRGLTRGQPLPSCCAVPAAMGLAAAAWVCEELRAESAESKGSPAQ